MNSLSEGSDPRPVDHSCYMTIVSMRYLPSDSRPHGLSLLKHVQTSFLKSDRSPKTTVYNLNGRSNFNINNSFVLQPASPFNRQSKLTLFVERSRIPSLPDITIPGQDQNIATHTNFLIRATRSLETRQTHHRFTHGQNTAKVGPSHSSTGIARGQAIGLRTDNSSPATSSVTRILIVYCKQFASLSLG